VWEAVTEPAAAALGNVLWVVDHNRQSLDQPVPQARVPQRKALFASAGWHICRLRYGRTLQERFAQPDGEALRAWFDALARRGAPGDVPARRACAAPPDPRLHATAAGRLRRGGPGRRARRRPRAARAGLRRHNAAALLAAYAECDAVADRPSVIFADTVKGWGCGGRRTPVDGHGLDRPGAAGRHLLRAGLRRALDWLLCDALARIGRGAPDSAAYFRLSSRPLDQEPFAVARVRHGEAELRRLVLAAAHWPYVSSRPRWRWSCSRRGCGPSRCWRSAAGRRRRCSSGRRDKRRTRDGGFG